MPRVRFSPTALRDLERIREFLRPKSGSAARRAAEAIITSTKLLESHGHAGRPAEGYDETYRELIIDFGDSGYVALYRFHGDEVIILTIRHQKEVGYHGL
jgi:addiction module RelE/StbE family toxin